LLPHGYGGGAAFAWVKGGKRRNEFPHPGGKNRGGEAEVPPGPRQRIDFESAIPILAEP